MKEFKVEFRRISDEEFDKFSKWSMSLYSQNLIKSGRCNEENALDCAKKDFNEILPRGKDTANNYIYIIVNSENEEIGVIWYDISSGKEAFICDFYILEKFRKQGYGEQSLFCLENEVKEKKVNRIGLNVFKYNSAAISLYNRLGYKINFEDSGSMYMVKDI